MFPYDSCNIAKMCSYHDHNLLQGHYTGVLIFILRVGCTINIQHIYKLFSGCVSTWALKPTYKCSNLHFALSERLLNISQHPKIL